MTELNHVEVAGPKKTPDTSAEGGKQGPSLDLVSLYQAGGKGEVKARIDAASPTHLDFSPDPFKRAELSQPKEQSETQIKSVDERLAAGRQHMNEIAEKYMTKSYPSILNGKMYKYAPTFQNDMQHFEDRLNAGQVSKEEVAGTYESIGKLVDTERGVVTPNRRLQLAKNIMFHAGDPTKTDQGAYNTCALTAEQERLFTRNPSKATEILTEAALTGQWVAPDGKVIKLDKLSLIPRDISGMGQPLDAERSYATQIMNNVLTNDIHQRKATPETYVQLQDKDKTGHRLRMDDSGERVFAKNGSEARNPDGSKERSPMVDDVELAAQIKRITGDTGVVLTNKNMTDAMQEEAPTKHTASELKDVVSITNRKQFEESLTAMKEQNKFPILLGLDGADKNLTRGLPRPKGPQDDGPSGHMLSVIDYDSNKGRVKISNQWGQASDRWLSLTDLYEATDPKYPPAPKNFRPHK